MTGTHAIFHSHTFLNQVHFHFTFYSKQFQVHFCLQVKEIKLNYEAANPQKHIRILSLVSFLFPI